MKLVATPDASRDIEAIHAFIAHDNRKAADRFVESLIARLDRLASSPFPGLGRAGQDPGIRELVHPPYVILYSVDLERDEFVILSVVHGARRR